MREVPSSPFDRSTPKMMKCKAKLGLRPTSTWLKSAFIALGIVGSPFTSIQGTGLCIISHFFSAAGPQSHSPSWISRSQLILIFVHLFTKYFLWPALSREYSGDENRCILELTFLISYIFLGGGGRGSRESHKINTCKMMYTELS